MKRISMWKAVIAVVVALAFILPGSAAFANVGTIKVTSSSKNAVDINNNIGGTIMSDTPREDIILTEKTVVPAVPLTRGTVYVDDNAAPEWYDATHVHTIQAGVNNATAGDTVYVYNGTYREKVNVNKQLNLTGESRENVIVNGSGSGNVFYITTPVTNVNINSFSITNGQYGVYIYKSSYNNISNCNITKTTSHGIYIYTTSYYNIVMNSNIHNCMGNGIYSYTTSDQNSIVNCNVYNNTNHGIYLRSSHNNVIANCNVYTNKNHGINLDVSSNNNLRNNTINDNAYNFGVVGTAVTNFPQDIDSSNTINGKTIRYLVGQSNQIISNFSYLGLVSCTNITAENSDVYGVVVVDTTYSTISNVSCHNSVNGIYLGYSSSHCNIINCNAHNNTYGIYARSSSNNNITNCDVYGNSQYGLYFLYLSDSNITDCTSHDNQQAIYLYSQLRCTLRGNSFYNNRYNFAIEFFNIAEATVDIDPSNMIEGRPIYYLVGQNNITLDESNNFGMLGLVNCMNITAKNSDVCGVLLVNTSYSTISNVTCHDAKDGFYIHSSGSGISTHNNIVNCTSYNNSARGFRIIGTYTNIANCTAYNNPGSSTSTGCGINIPMAPYTTVKNCTVYDNGLNGFLVDINSIYCNITNCEVYGNRYGIQIGNGCENSTVANCLVHDNRDYGIYLWASNCYINNCTMSGQLNPTYGVGIYIFAYSKTIKNCTITHCNSYNNKWGIRTGVYNGLVKNMLIYSNNFINNWRNALDVYANMYDNGTVGNYWSDYQDYYPNATQVNGIWDTPYEIIGGANKDNYPLVNPLDNNPPLITMVQATPAVQNTTEPVNITCAVTDNWDLVDTVKINISGPEGFTLETTMNEGSYYYEDTYTTMGIYFYYIRADDTSGNIAVSDTYSFVITDLETPTSAVNSLPTWKKVVPFAVTATAYDATGVENVTLWYRYSTNGTSWTAWTSYGTDIAAPWSWSFTGSDGYYQFYSIAIDDYGNVEEAPATADTSTGIDTTKPITTHLLNGTLGDNNWYKSVVTVTLSATDNLSGVETTWYKLDAGYWQLYSASFTVSSEGQHTVSYYSFDQAGNQEAAKSVSFKIDTAAPTTTHTLQGLLGSQGWYVTNVTVTLSAHDVTSGVNFTKYKLNDGSWMTYTGSFVVTTDGNYTLQYYSVDFAGNTEATKQAAFRIQHDVLPPVTTHEFGGILGENNWFISTVTVTLSAVDDSAGVASTKYKLDAGPLWTTYTGAFPVTEDAEHTLYYYSVDKVGNREENKSATLKIDQTAPTINLTVEKTGLNKWLLTATVSDETSGVAKVEFYVDGEFVGEDAEAPYELEYAGTGDTAQAIVYDNANNSATSAEVKDQAAPDSQSQSSMLTSVSVSKDTIQGQSISSTLQRLFNLR